jgi:pimeloyl-ACP methyl ester carboxylesterase
MEERQRAFGPAAAAVGRGDLHLGARMLIEALINKGPGTWDAGPEHLKQMIQENTRTLPLMFAAPPAPPITYEELQHLSIPVLIINGAETMRFYSYIGEQMEKCLPNVQRQVIANASHGIETQNPTAYWKFLRDFLKEH